MSKYPYLTKDEIQWIEQSKALRPDAPIDDLITSFLALFPDRAAHPELSGEQIRQKLKTRFKDVISRRGKENIETRRTEYEQMFSTYAVFDPRQQLQHYESIFTDPKSKPTEKSKAIADAEKVRAKLLPEKSKAVRDAEAAVERHQFEEKRQRIQKWREDIEKILQRKQHSAVYETLDEALKAEIEYPDRFDRYDLLEIRDREDLHAELERLDIIRRDQRCEELSDAAVEEIYRRFYHIDGTTSSLTLSELDALINAHLKDPPPPENPESQN